MKIIESNQELITSPYGPRPEFGDFHTGLDIVRYHDGYCDLDYICAKEKGVVCNVRKDCQGFEAGGSYGNFVHIDHGNGMSTVYAHIAYNTIPVNIGDTVEEEQIIGYMGATGTAYGGHVHFEVREWNNPIDPTPYFNGKRMVDPIDKSLPTPVEENKEVDQFKVNCDDTMRVRLDHNLNAEIIGSAQTGFYNILNRCDDDGYTWFEVEKNKWIALLPPYSDYIPKPDENIFIEIIKLIIEIIKKIFKKGNNKNE